MPCVRLRASEESRRLPVNARLGPCAQGTEELRAPPWLSCLKRRPPAFRLEASSSTCAAEPMPSRTEEFPKPASALQSLPPSALHGHHKFRLWRCTDPQSSRGIPALRPARPVRPRDQNSTRPRSCPDPNSPAPCTSHLGPWWFSRFHFLWLLFHARPPPPLHPK